METLFYDNIIDKLFMNTLIPPMSSNIEQFSQSANKKNLRSIPFEASLKFDFRRNSGIKNWISGPIQWHIFKNRLLDKYVLVIKGTGQNLDEILKLEKFMQYSSAPALWNCPILIFYNFLLHCSLRFLCFTKLDFWENKCEQSLHVKGVSPFVVVV